MHLIFRFLTKNAQQNHVLIRRLYSTRPSTLSIYQRNGSILKPTQTLLLKNVRPEQFNQLISKRLLSSNHAKIWVLEKIISAGLLVVIPAAFMFPSSFLDYALALSLAMHCHWGFEAMIVDYIRPNLFGPVIPKIALAGVYLLSMLALAGLCYMNYSDVGLSTAIKMFMNKV